MTIEIRSTARSPETESRILALLDTAAQVAGHPFDVEHLTFEAWEGDTFCGGLTARVEQNWLYVAYLAVTPDQRGTGLGGTLLGKAEAAAAERGLNGIWLDTFSFEAPGFYEKLGFAAFGKLEDSPTGGARYFFAKRLTGPR